MDETTKVQELEQEMREMKAGFAAMMEMKNKQLEECKRVIREYDKICDQLKANILAKDNELARMR